MHTYRRSLARYRLRALAVWALGCLAAAAVAAYCPLPIETPALPAAPLVALEPTPPVAPKSESKPTSQRAALATRQAELNSELTVLDARLRQNESDIIATEEKIALLSVLLAAPAVMPVTIEQVAPPRAADELQQQLDDLRSREHRLTAQMHDNHPQLQAVRQHIADLEAGLHQSPAKHNPVQRQAIAPAETSESIAVERARVQTLATERRSLLAARERLSQELAELKVRMDNSPEVPHLDSAAETAQHASTPAVTVTPLTTAPALPAANLAAAASSPSRSTIFAAGLLLSALLGLLTAVISAAKNPLLCTPRQLEVMWDLPLTGSIPPNLRVVTDAA